MAEESSDLVKTSPVKAEPEADGTGESSVKNCQKIVSRYLKPHVGSCHDFCKFGRRRHDQSEEKPWKALRRRVEKSRTVPNEHVFVQVVLSGEEKCKKNIIHKPLSDYKVHLHDAIIKSSDKKKVVEKKPSEDSRTYSPNAASLRKLSSSDTKLDRSRQNASSGGRPTSLLKNDVSFTKKSQSPNPPEIIMKELVVPSESAKALREQYTRTDVKMSPSTKKAGNIPKDRSYPVKSVKLQSVTPKPPQPLNSHSDSVHEKIEASGECAKKSLTPRSATSYPRVSLTKRAPAKAKQGGGSKLSPLKGLSSNTRGVGPHTLDHEKLPEKVLHVIKTEAVEVMPQHADDDHALANEEASYLSPHVEEYDEAEYSDDEADELINEAVEIENGEETNEKSERKISKDQCISSSEKMRFKSGKVVDSMSDDNSPRRLRFRKAGTLKTEDGKSELNKRTFKKAESNDATAQLSSEKVVLKRQDVEGKKDAQGLLNNVIEQTASKLVETRKSKVKALVGAFETVISLHETKPVN